MSSVIIPSLGLDPSLIERFFTSVDYGVLAPMIVMANKDAKRNLGVAGAWNHGISKTPNSKWWLIVNEDVWFNPGQLQNLCGLADQLCDDCHVIYADTGFECFVWTHRGHREIGTFDENFWPLYYEDNDMRIRLALAGNLTRSAGIKVNHGKPKVGGPNYEGLVKGCGLFNREYLLRKWGSLDEPMWDNPFRAVGRTPRMWTLERERRTQLEAIWNTFFAMPDPSIYT